MVRYLASGAMSILEENKSGQFSLTISDHGEGIFYQKNDFTNSNVNINLRKSKLWV